MEAASTKSGPPDLSLTDFVDFVHKSGTARATHLRQIKERPDYEPAFDFYRPLRNKLAEVHGAGLG